MKKLNKILVTISTVTLLSCVWGVNTHAEVKKNDLGVPTHIEADNHAEFLRDLKEVLKYITDNLEDREEKAITLLQYRCNDWVLANPLNQTAKTYEELASYEYGFVLTKTRMTYDQSTSYLYLLLRESTINAEPLKNVWIMYVAYNKAENTKLMNEIIFQLPAVFSEYCTCCMRWHLLPNKPGKVGPWFLQDSFSQEFRERTQELDILGLLIIDPTETFGSERQSWPKMYRKGQWKRTWGEQKTISDNWGLRCWLEPVIQTNDITKLISISTVDTKDRQLVTRFLEDKNRTTDFATFKKENDASREMFTPD